MSASKFTKAEKYQLIMECRASGLSDYAWCKQHDIQPGTFYNWVSRFRKEACEIPKSNSKNPDTTIAVKQEVVRLDIQPDSCEDLHSYTQQNACIESSKTTQPTIQLKVGGMEIDITNDVDPMLLSTVLRSLGGVSYVR